MNNCQNKANKTIDVSHYFFCKKMKISKNKNLFPAIILLNH